MQWSCFTTVGRCGYFLAGVGVAVAVIVGCAAVSRGASPRYRPSFSVVIVPDTQQYAELEPEMFDAQMRWILGTRERLNTAFVVHVGDVVQTDAREEWQVADRAFDMLDGVVPYVIALGNHDIGQARGEGTRDSTRANEVFPPSRFVWSDAFGGTMDGRIENSYSFFSEAGLDFMVVTLEVVPRDDVLAWANTLIAAHPERRTIVVTHAYLTADAQSFPRDRFSSVTNKECCHDGNEGVDMWDRLIRNHANIFLVVSGHDVHQDTAKPASGFLVGTGDYGNPVFQLMVNYQTQGYGWMRVLRFIPEEDIVVSIPVTPLRKGVYTDAYDALTQANYFDSPPGKPGFHFRNDPQHAFVFSYPMAVQ